MLFMFLSLFFSLIHLSPLISYCPQKERVLGCLMNTFVLFVLFVLFVVVVVVVIACLILMYIL